MTYCKNWNLWSFQRVYEVRVISQSLGLTVYDPMKYVGWDHDYLQIT